MTKLYICDGVKPDCDRTHCYCNKGECTHTTDVRHSIKRRLKEEFPPTIFVKLNLGRDHVEVEHLSIESFMKGMYDCEWH